MLGLVVVSYELLRWFEGMSSSAGAKMYVVSSLSQLFVYVTFTLVLAFLFLRKKRVRYLWSRMMRILGRFDKLRSAQSQTTESEDQNLAPK